MYKKLLAVVFLSLLVALAVLMWQRGPSARLLGETFAASSVGGSGMGLGDYGPVQDFSLLSQGGEVFQRNDLLGSIWIADFVFTNCASSCPMMTSALQDIAAELPENAHVKLVSISVDPERDTPQRLREYMQIHGVRASNDAASVTDWVFLTGDKDAIYDLVANGFHLSVRDISRETQGDATEPILHSTRFVLVDRQGRIRGYYNGLDESGRAELLRDVKILARQKTS